MSEQEKHPGGRPPLYKTPEELQAKINQYFDIGVNVRTVIVGPPNKRYDVTIKVPTITGLCQYCGFESRQSFYAYEDKPEFSYTIKKARLRIEQEYEEQLQIGTPTGAIFALKNFGWKDEQTVNNNIEARVAMPMIEKDGKPLEYKVGD